MDIKLGGCMAARRHKSSDDSFNILHSTTHSIESRVSKFSQRTTMCIVCCMVRRMLTHQPHECL